MSSWCPFGQDVVLHFRLKIHARAWHLGAARRVVFTLESAHSIAPPEVGQIFCHHLTRTTEKEDEDDEDVLWAIFFSDGRCCPLYRTLPHKVSNHKCGRIHVYHFLELSSLGIPGWQLLIVSGSAESGCPKRQVVGGREEIRPKFIGRSRSPPMRAIFRGTWEPYICGWADLHLQSGRRPQTSMALVYGDRNCELNFSPF